MRLIDKNAGGVDIAVERKSKALRREEKYVHPERVITPAVLR